MQAITDIPICEQAAPACIRSSDLLGERLPVHHDSQLLKTRKILVLTCHVRDYRLLEEMLANAREKVPDLEMDSVVSAIVADACRSHRAKQSCPPNAEVSDGGGHQAPESANDRYPPPFAPPKS